MTNFPLGAHVHAESAIDDAKARGASIIQIMIGAPTAWKGHELAFPGGASALKGAAQEAGVGIYVHAPYIINVASLNNRIRIPSRKLLQAQLDLAAEIDALGLIVHGGHAGEDLSVGYDNWRKALDAVDMHVPILIENTASGDGAVARGADRIAALWPAVLAGKDGERRSEEHTSELQSRGHLVCRLLLEKKKRVNRDMYLTDTQWSSLTSGVV